MQQVYNYMPFQRRPVIKFLLGAFLNFALFMLLVGGDAAHGRRITNFPDAIMRRKNIFIKNYFKKSNRFYLAKYPAILCKKKRIQQLVVISLFLVGNWGKMEVGICRNN